MQNDVLDIVIGLVFVWFLLSVLLAAIGEGISLMTRLVHEVRHTSPAASW